MAGPGVVPPGEGHLLTARGAFALPFSFEREDYVQILSDMAGKLGPALGWQPAADR